MTFAALVLLDFTLLFHPGNSITAKRETPEKLSNGDDNPIILALVSRYRNPLFLKIIDEIPYQFQERNFLIETFLKPGEEKKFTYHLKPTVRGEYAFGQIRIFAHTFIGLVTRRISIQAAGTVPVYPSFLQMRKYHLLAVSNRLEEAGIKKIRKTGMQSEFDQIREYVTGDDYRMINWKATARKAGLMVNQFQEEKAQEIYCMLDLGRNMKMPFDGMTLLDYAVNSSLVISNIALKKNDKAGIATFSDRIHGFIPADRKSMQLNKILELLYKVETGFPESNYELLYTTIRRNVKQRALLILFTNFESVPSMQRQLPLLKKLTRNHLLLTVFFQNTELNKLLIPKVQNLENSYTSIVAEGFIYDRKVIVKELNNHGIHCLLTGPKALNVNLINKYLEFKSRGLI